jgi:hypothetical protein
VALVCGALFKRMSNSVCFAGSINYSILLSIGQDRQSLLVRSERKVVFVVLTQAVCERRMVHNRERN